MDRETVELLEKNRLSEYIDVFKYHRIGLDELKELNTEAISQLINPIGDRLRFIRAIEYRESHSNLGDESIERSTKRQRNTYSVNAKIIQAQKNSEGKRNLKTAESSQLESVKASCDLPLRPCLSKNHLISEDQPSTSQSSKDPSESKHGRKKIKDAEDLKEFLSSCADGKVILQIFESDGKLNEFLRTKLTGLLVDKLLMDHDNNLSNDVFQAAAEKICELFPTECVGTYYISPLTEGNKQTISKGKLPYRYRNRRNTLKKHGVISSEKKNTQDVTLTIDSTKLLPNDDLNKVKFWLAHHSEPWKKVLKLWTATAFNRLQEFKESETITIAEIVKEWAALQHPLGYTLVSVDFKIAYPDKEVALLNGFPLHRDRLLQIMVSRPRKDKHASLLIARDVKDDSSDACKDATILSLLPALLPPTIIRTDGKKILWKPTIAESQDAFVVHVKTVADMKITRDVRRKTYEKFGRSIQPFVVIVGNSLDEINQSYVILGNVTYQLENPLAAVDLCFKVFHVWNLQYPPEAYNPWMFIQRYFYGIKTKFDKVSCTVTAIMSDL